MKIEIENRGSVRHTLDLPYTDTYIKVVLQAHNERGYSDEAALILRAYSGYIVPPQKGYFKLFFQEKKSQKRPQHQLTII